jgi:hypothetical protein
MAISKDFQLKRGQRIKASVEEVMANNDIIVSFQGNLIRVGNATQRLVRAGEVLDLQVVGTDPLEFRFFNRATNSFDRLV